MLAGGIRFGLLQKCPGRPGLLPASASASDSQRGAEADGVRAQLPGGHGGQEPPDVGTGAQAQGRVVGDQVG